MTDKIADGARGLIAVLAWLKDNPTSVFTVGFLGAVAVMLRDPQIARDLFLWCAARPHHTAVACAMALLVWWLVHLSNRLSAAEENIQRLKKTRSMFWHHIVACKLNEGKTYEQAVSELEDMEAACESDFKPRRFRLSVAKERRADSHQ